MDLELVKFINSDLTWNTVKKGHRSTMRRPRRPGASSSEFGIGLGDKKQDSFVFDYEKSGVAVLGQHFGEEVLDVPIKKRILLLQSPSLSGEGARSTQPQTPSSHHEESELPVGSKHASGKHLKLTEKEVPDMNDFSGIELLAAAACCSSVYDSSGYKESSAVEEHTTPKVDTYADGIKENIASMDSGDSSVQDGTLPVAQNLCDNENGKGDNKLVPTKGVRLHWDLNTVMDEWEEPCCDILVDPHSERSYLKDVHDDGPWDAKANLKGYDCRNSQVTEGEQGSMLHSVCVNQSGKHNAAISVMLRGKQEICGIEGNSDGDSFERTYDVVENIASLREVVGAITCKTSDAESGLSKSDVVDSFVQPATCENFSTSTVSVSPGQTTIKVESDELPMYCEPSNKSDDRPAVSEVVEGGCLSLKGDSEEKLTSEDRLSDCCGSNVSQDERGHMAEGNTRDKVKAGYDSPVEDGELRESARYQNEVEERECVDYESDNIYEDNSDTIESVKNEITLDHHQTNGDGHFMVEDRGLGAVPSNDSEIGDKMDVSKGLSHQLGSKSSLYKLNEHSQCANLEEKDGSSVKFISERKNTYDEFPGVNSLCIDRSSSFGVHKNGAYIRRSRSDNIGDSFPRAERGFGPPKFVGRDGLSYQGHARNDGSGQWEDLSMGAWDSRNSHVYPRSKNVIGSSAARSGVTSSVDNNRAIKYNPRGIYRTFNPRPSPSDRNESYNIHKGTSLARSISRDRSGFHLLGLRRPTQEEYHDPEPSYSERRVRCFSPNFSRGAHLSRSRRRSRSRSRSGSPIAWHFQKKRNVDTKRQSPDDGSDTRFQGERLPLRKPSSSGEIEAGIVSPTRGRMSPQCLSRSYDDRNIINGQFRERRSSPARTFNRSQRFEAGGYLGKVKSNDHLRPTPRPGRFPQVGPNREKFDGTIHEDKYGMMNGGRRFRYEVALNKDNGFRYGHDENRCFKHPVGRDVSENTSEEKGCRYTNSRMFALSAGEGDFHKDDL